MRFNPIIVISMLSCNILFSQTLRQLGDINSGIEGSAAFNDNSSFFFNDILFFSADDGIHGDELWVYENFELRLVKDINPGDVSSDIQYMHVINNKLIFIATNEEVGTEWWQTDGTEEGTSILIDIREGTANGVFTNFGYIEEGFKLYNDELYFTGSKNGDFELWKTDGTLQGTKLVKNIAPYGSSFPESYVIFDDELYFSCSEGLWKTNGLTSGTKLVEDTDPDDNFGFNPKYLFSTEEYMLMIQGDNLWVSDGTGSGTKKIANFEHVNVNWTGPRFQLVDDYVLFPGDDGVKGDELWRTQGTEQTTELVIDLWEGTGGYAPQNTVLFNGEVYFKGDDGETDIELYKSDGTHSGTELVYEFGYGSNSGFSLPTNIVADDNFIYMNAGAAFNEGLWVSDGTEPNTQEILINPDNEAKPRSFYLFDGKLFFFAKTAMNGYEPFILEMNAIDLDGDGFSMEEDCDDEDPSINPSAEEIPNNGVDEDCDGEDLVTSITRFEKSNLKVYPNPASEFLNILKEIDDTYIVKLRNFTGETVIHATNVKTLDLKLIPSGIYIVQIFDIRGNSLSNGQVLMVK